MADVLPDSRARRPKGSVRRPDGWWVPIYCANCGRSGGLVPEDTTTFAFWLCPQTCSEHLGHLAHFYVEPDTLFWRKIEEEQLERYGRLLGNAELIRVLDESNHPLAKLAKDRFKGARP